MSCPECGATVHEGLAGCQAIFEAVIAREFGDYRYGRVHRLTVDVYSLQHPDRYMRSAKSYAAHLTGMQAAMDGGDERGINRSVQQWLSGNPPLQRPDVPPPGRRGALTIDHVHQARDADSHVQRVQDWAADVWTAWRDFRAPAEAWILEAAASTGGRRRGGER